MLHPAPPYISVGFGKVAGAKGVPSVQQSAVGTRLGLRSGVLGGPAPFPCGPRTGVAVQEHLLSSSYCVRLGRVRFRMENRATGPGGRGARGDSRQRLVHTPTPRGPRRAGGGGRERAAHTGVRGQGRSWGKGAAPRTLLSPLLCVLVWGRGGL